MTRWPSSHTNWPNQWAHYDEPTYAQALSFIQPGQSVLDIGAGDLRFARRLAQQGCQVIALEQRAEVVRHALRQQPCPPTVQVVIADARRWPFPTGINVAVLLMQYCADFAHYIRKLRVAGCPVLVTNTRWRLGVESIPLNPADPYNPHRAGAYACVRCGAVGFTEGSPQLFVSQADLAAHNVEGCPTCLPANHPIY